MSTRINTSRRRGGGGCSDCGKACMEPNRECDNYGEDHVMSVCNMPCGHCGGWSPGEYDVYWHMVARGELPDRDSIHEPGESHFAPDCPKAKNNRCKCMPFPVYHTAKRCMVKCRPRCGHPDPGRHKGNAMMCTYRCCMCGIRDSHAGKDCRLKRCRWGAHLGQDHGWNRTCRKEGVIGFCVGFIVRGVLGRRGRLMRKRGGVGGVEGWRRDWRRGRRCGGGGGGSGRVEVARRFYAGGLGDGSKVEGKVKEKDGPRVWLTKARYEAAEVGKAGSRDGYQSIFGGGSSRDDACPCRGPVKPESCSV
ncbi:hypothetical protein QC764_606405 [Podospora pseudoanserina]|uniref:Uncharacterized protein n=1 Tax=Podospora pseudoanserina TaxID=2609844 RepID=A0ABR0HUA9_9PEZI|nr:hypothetical protein QC764_606405 [Podospora pseudoanserina]